MNVMEKMVEKLRRENPEIDEICKMMNTTIEKVAKFRIHMESDEFNNRPIVDWN